MSIGADPVDRSDDIAHLRQHLGLPEMNYQDISTMVDLRQALQRWPLLQESCAQLSDEAEPAWQVVAS
ncbi:MAG: hypothetical protein E6Q69_14225 [Aquipseudomonas alcaligenes]|uniref:Cellulose biosynthesis protein BcsR n=1 Tax=Aquipseudomonas alcaligenes TaxID=43263 RepID=A0A5C7W0F0_AQUAC|nr:MAG: hypothetical protein E6Q69_14225 [Pseudomonas alcaligenes]